jgi:hypothetical protein
LETDDNAATALLAKALTDLEVSQYLVEAAEDERLKRQWDTTRSFDRSAQSTRSAEPYLGLLLGQETAPPNFDRSAQPPTTPASARLGLATLTEDSLALIAARAQDTTKSVLERLLGLGASDLAKAAGIVGLDIAQALGISEHVMTLSGLARRFIAQSYEAVIALLSPTVIKAIGEIIPGWVEKFKENEPVGRILESLYATAEAKATLKAQIEDSAVELADYQNAWGEVDALCQTFLKRVDLVDKSLPKLAWVALLPAAQVPQGKLVMAVAYVALGGYIIFLGADYVDAPRLQGLDRVPGIRRIIERCAQVDAPRPDPSTHAEPTGQ